MKRLILLVLILALLFCLCACGEESEGSVARFPDDFTDLRGAQEITPEMRLAFNLFARENQYNYLPNMDGYESLFEVDETQYSGLLGHTRFADAVFYILQRNQGARISAEQMEQEIQSLFYAKEGEYTAMPHQEYGKFALYADGNYSPWPEGGLDTQRQFYLLTGLEIEADSENGSLLYIETTARNYYFNDVKIYEAGEKETWLQEQMEMLDAETDLAAATQLLENGELENAPQSTEIITTILVNTGAEAPSYQFVENRSVAF